MKNKQNTFDTRFSSNAVKLSVREWLAAVVFVVVIVLLLPPLWRHQEVSSPPADYRIPYDLSEDYWLFKQYCRSVCGLGKTLVLGDSVVWGHYVGQDQTLAHHLNGIAGSDRFVNLGLDGSHPMALYGLVRHYGKAIKGEKVILHMNLLWLSSPEADLQTKKELRFNHPRLVPQFRPRIPGYTESDSGRIGIVLERIVPFLQWVRHIQAGDFGNRDLQQWTVENPYTNPLGRISVKPLGTGKVREKGAQSEAQSEAERAPVLQSLPWVEFETSLQWWAFESLIGMLESRGNDVLVAVGPLNEHVLAPASISTYRTLLSKAEKRLEQMDVPYLPLPLLPSRLYVDTSHPQGQGYRVLAEYLWNRLNQ